MTPWPAAAICLDGAKVAEVGWDLTIGKRVGAWELEAPIEASPVTAERPGEVGEGDDQTNSQQRECGDQGTTVENLASKASRRTLMGCSLETLWLTASRGRGYISSTRMPVTVETSWM